MASERTPLTGGTTGDETTGQGTLVPLHQTAGTRTTALPQLRVMSPSSVPDLREMLGHLQAACYVCNRKLEGGPLVVCGCCQQPVHSHCALAVMHTTVCERCVGELQASEQGRQQQHAAARALGYAGARAAETLGAAAGAVSAAGMAAGQLLVRGAQTGARSAWGGAGTAAQRPPPLEVHLPRPASLPPPLPEGDAAPASGTPVVSAGAGAALGRPTLRHLMSRQVTKKCRTPSECPTS